jgi:hypothetical protein
LTHAEGGTSENIHGSSDSLPAHKSFDSHPSIIPLYNTNSSKKSNEKARKSGPQTVQTEEQQKE